MNSKTQTKSSWDLAVEYKMSLGYSREYAEAATPMSVAEMRRRGLTARRYVSPITTLNGRKAR